MGWLAETSGDHSVVLVPGCMGWLAETSGDHSVMLVPGCMSWLVETSTDLREAVAHLRHVRYDALYKSTVVYFTFPNRSQSSTRKMRTDKEESTVHSAHR